MRGGFSILGQYARLCGSSLRRAATPQSGGFTIVEVMIVLAVSGALFVSAALLISGRQNRTAFDQATRQAQSQIQQALNEVSTGYYPNNSNFRCQAGSSGQPPVLSTGSTAQGANNDCIFVGKVLQFKVAGTDPEQFIVHTVAGLKRGGGGGAESSTLAEARPMLVSPSSPSHNNPGYPDNSSVERLQHGLTVARMWYRDELGVDRDTGAVAFVNGLANYGASGALMSGGSRVDIIAADNSNGSARLGLSKLEMAEALNSDGGNRLVSGTLNPRGGVFICFEGGTDSYAIVQIGGESRDLTVSLRLKNKGGGTCTYP